MEITCQEVCRKLIVLAFYNNSTWNQFLEALCMQQSLHSTTEPCTRLNYEVWVLATKTLTHLVCNIEHRPTHGYLLSMWSHSPPG